MRILSEFFHRNWPSAEVLQEVYLNGIHAPHSTRFLTIDQYLQSKAQAPILLIQNQWEGTNERR